MSYSRDFKNMLFSDVRIIKYSVSGIIAKYGYCFAMS